MDFKTMVLNAARDGGLHQLKIFLDGKSRTEVSALVSARTNGTTPLIMACRNGHLYVALYLIESCKADIEQVGTVTFDHEMIECVPPLWCAAVNGHLNIVKMLVKHNASVNGTAKTNTTALRAACSEGQFEIAKYLILHGADIEIANRNDNTTCLMIACSKEYCEIVKYLLECGADTDRKSVEGNTALHFCAKSDNLCILKMLLQSGAKSYCNSYGTTPLLSAAIRGHFKVFECLAQEFSYTTQETVNALKLLGCAFIDTNSDMIKAFECWKKAMDLSYENGGSPLEKPATRSPIASFFDATEVSTFHELEELLNDPDQMRVQAMLAVERILGPGHPDTFLFIMNSAQIYSYNGNGRNYMKLRMYALQAQQTFQEPLNSVPPQSLFIFASLFNSMMLEGSQLQRCVPPLSLQDILNVFEICLKSIETYLYAFITQKVNNYTSYIHEHLIVAMYLIGLMCRLQPHRNTNDYIILKKAVYKLVHLNPKTMNGWTPLHLACCGDPLSIMRGYRPSSENKFSSSEVVNLLLEVGACPNAVDSANNTPLHVAAMNMPCASVFKELLNHGAHLDVCNYDRKTPLQLSEATSSLDIFPVRYITLQCLCARTIREHEIAYQVFVHEKLKHFIDSH